MRGKIGFCWESRGKRDVRDVGFGGWSRSDVAAVAENRWRRGLKKRVAIGRIGLCLGAFALTALGNSMACMSGKRAWGRVVVVGVRRRTVVGIVRIAMRRTVGECLWRRSVVGWRFGRDAFAVLTLHVGTKREIRNLYGSFGRLVVDGTSD